MKTIWWSVLLSLLCLQLVMAQKYETQAFEVIKKVGDAEIRYYPSVMRIKTYQSNGFSSLFGFISGRNSTGLKIAMTTPVYMQEKEGARMMEFILPKHFTPENVPKSVSQQVAVYESEPAYFIAYTFGGYSFDWISKRATQKLRDIIEKNQLKIIDEPLLLVYNSPYQVLNRKNEILFKIQYNPNEHHP